MRACEPVSQSVSQRAIPATTASRLRFFFCVCGGGGYEEDILLQEHCLGVDEYRLKGRGVDRSCLGWRQSENHPVTYTQNDLSPTDIEKHEVGWMDGIFTYVKAHLVLYSIGRSILSSTLSLLSLLSIATEQKHKTQKGSTWITTTHRGASVRVPPASQSNHNDFFLRNVLVW